MLVLILALAATTGCATFGRRGPTDEKVLAARELCRLGQDAWESNRCSEAYARFAHALELCPQHVDSRQHYARALWQRGEREEALAQMRKVVEQTEGDPSAATELGHMLLQTNELPEAMACAEMALTRDRRMTDALVLRGDVLRVQGRSQEALDSYHLARSFGCRDPRVLLEMADLALRTNRPDRALATLDHLHDVPPPEALKPRQHLLAGIAYRSLQRNDESIEQLQQAIALVPDDPEVLTQLGETLIAAGRTRESEPVMATLARIAPNDPRTARLSQQLQLAQDATTGGSILR